MTSSPVELGALDGQPDDVPDVPLLAEAGLTGLRRAAGYIDEEFLPQLRGRKAVQVFREMSDNEAVIGAFMYAIERLLRNLEWQVKAADGPDGQAAAEFVTSCMDDMSHTWGDLMAEIVSMIIYGWSWHEICYKRRQGPWQKDPTKRSKYNDGKIGWRKMPIRAQETLFRWVFDDKGGVRAMIQMAPPFYQSVTIPIEKSLLFRVTAAKGNPEGRSMLRNAYRSWYYKKRMEEIEGVGAERDLAGLPVAKVPMRILTAAPGSTDAQVLDAYRKLVRNTRRDEHEGVIVPSEVDDNGKELYDFSLLSSGGSRQFDTNGIIQRYEERILMTVLADFILVGHESVGSYSLHTDKSGLFRTALNSIAQSIADVFNRYAIPRLFEVNGWKTDDLPELVPADVDTPDLTQLAGFMTALQQAGVQWFPDPELEKFLRQAARLPAMDEQQLMVRETEEKDSFVQRLAQQRLDLLNLQAQAEGSAQQMVGGQMQLQAQGQQLNDPQGPDAQAAAQADQTQAAGKQSLQQSQQRHQLAMQAAKAKMAQSDASAKQKSKHLEQMHALRLAQAAKKTAGSGAAKKTVPAKKAPPAKGGKR